MSEWISVLDKLPKEGDNVIVWVQTSFNFGNCGHSIAYYDNGNWWGSIGRDEQVPCIDIYYDDGGISRMESHNITHWMPLPNPPTEAS